VNALLAVIFNDGFGMLLDLDRWCLGKQAATKISFKIGA